MKRSALVDYCIMIDQRLAQALSTKNSLMRSKQTVDKKLFTI